MLMDTMKMVSSAQVVEQDGTTKYLGAAVYDIAGSTLSTPTDAATLMRFSVNRPFTMDSGFGSSFAESTVATTAITVYSVQRNGVEVGTITFAAGSNAGVFAGTGGSFVAGDVLTVEAPATADTTHDGIAWTMATSF